MFPQTTDSVIFVFISGTRLITLPGNYMTSNTRYTRQAWCCYVVPPFLTSRVLRIMENFLILNLLGEIFRNILDPIQRRFLSWHIGAALTKEGGATAHGSNHSIGHFTLKISRALLVTSKYIIFVVVNSLFSQTQQLLTLTIRLLVYSLASNQRPITEVTQSQ